MSDSAVALEAEGKQEQGTPESNERAVALFERALRVDPGFASAYVGLTRAYVQRTTRLRLGRSWLDSAVAAGAQLALAGAYRSKGALRKELDLWRRRAHLEPSDADATEPAGWILWFTGRPDEALSWLETTVAQRPAGRWGHFYLGNANLALGNYSEAERMYRRMVELHANHSSAHAGVIWSLLAAGKDEEARSRLRTFQARPLDGDRYYLKVADIGPRREREGPGARASSGRGRSGGTLLATRLLREHDRRRASLVDGPIRRRRCAPPQRADRPRPPRGGR